MKNPLPVAGLRWLLPAVLLALPALAGDAQATTYKDVAYAVHFEGSGTYEKVDHYDYGDEWTEEEVDVRFDWSGDLGDGVVFRNGHPFETSADDIPTATMTGTWTGRGSGTAPFVCPAEESQPAHGLMRITEPEVAPLDGETHIYLRPFEQLQATFDCGGSHPGVELWESSALGEDGTAPPGAHTYDYAFSLPPEVFGMGYVEQLIPARTFTGAKCPSFFDHATTKCRLEWSGKVVFRKLWENTVRSDGAPLPPSAGPGDAPPQVAPLVPKPPVKQPSTVSDDDDFLVPLVGPGDAKLDANGTTATVKVTCPQGCAGEVALIPLVGKASAAAAKRRKAKPLAHKRFTAKPGKDTTIRLKLGPKARKTLRRQRRARLRLTYTTPVRRTESMTLRLRRR